MQALTQLLATQGFDEAECQNITACFVQRSYAKGALFLTAGAPSDQLGFVLEGVFQFYCFREGDEITTYVSGQHSFIVSLSSFLRGSVSKENIRAITEAQVAIISRDQFRDLIKTSEKFRTFYTGILEYQIVCIDDSRHNLLMLSAEERYEQLLSKEPQLLQQVPLQYLAAVLGITPRHLSRIRKNIS